MANAPSRATVPQMSLPVSPRPSYHLATRNVSQKNGGARHDLVDSDFGA
jgi:hypothetical protein